MAASVCYLAGCYKFTLDVKGSRVDFFKYKLIVLFQLGVILYTRVYLWFPRSLSLRAYIRDKNDTSFFYGCTVMVSHAKSTHRSATACIRLSSRSVVPWDLHTLADDSSTSVYGPLLLIYLLLHSSSHLVVIFYAPLVVVLSAFSTGSPWSWHPWTSCLISAYLFLASFFVPSPPV